MSHPRAGTNDRRARHARRASWRWAALVAGAFAWAAAVQAQPASAGVVRGLFRLPEYDKDEPNRIRSLLTGVGASAQANGLISMNTLRWEGYTRDGKTNLVILGTNCVFDARNRLAYSPDRLRMESPDGRFVVEGLGFLWRPTNSHLIISNRVHTRLQAPPSAPASTRP
jgi:hypothetical protein